jgi:hypothetical protein
LTESKLETKPQALQISEPNHQQKQSDPKHENIHPQVPDRRVRLLKSVAKNTVQTEKKKSNKEMRYLLYLKLINFFYHLILTICILSFVSIKSKQLADIAKMFQILFLMQILAFFGYLNLDGYKKVNRRLASISLVIFGQNSNEFTLLDSASSKFLTSLSLNDQYFSYFQKLNAAGLNSALDELRIDYLAWNRVGALGWLYIAVSIALIVLTLALKLVYSCRRGKSSQQEVVNN